MNNKLPSNTVMAVTIYNVVCDAYEDMILDNHRHANPDHPKASAMRRRFEELKMLFESATGVYWSYVYDHYGPNLNCNDFMEALEDGEN